MSEPLLISGMRRHPSGTVVHYPEPPIGKCGTSTRGFLAEVDGWLAEEREAGAAELRARVEAVLDEWVAEAGPDSEAHRVFGPQVVSVPHIDKTLRAALNGGE